MRLEELREKRDARPFRPFELRLNDGRKAVVDQPEVIWIPPEEGVEDVIMVWVRGRGNRIIDTRSIIEIAPLRSNGRKRR